MHKVKVYYNLHKHCWSIVDFKTRRVIDHRTELVLINCLFKVCESGRQRVLKTKHKNVHATIVGYLIEDDVNNDVKPFVQIWYNPYKSTHFKYGDIPVKSASKVRFYNNKTVTAELDGLISYGNN